ncbi:hypothetical protein ACGFR8_23225 [Streptomyces brevispora]
MRETTPARDGRPVALAFGTVHGRTPYMRFFGRDGAERLLIGAFSEVLPC